MNLKTYDEVITHLKKDKRERHLFLGNGFSMAYDSKIFSYNALSKFIENSQDKLLQSLFKIVNNKNFEIIMQQLEIFKKIAETFSTERELIVKIDAATNSLKTSLIDAVNKMHPEHVFSIPEEKNKKCASFLSDFLSEGYKIFTTNYDILLYWILMRNDITNKIDGFGRYAENYEEYIPDREIEYSCLIWGKNKEKQNINYLHGSLPIFDTGSVIIKEEYGEGKYLLKNINDRISNGEYPIFVTAGNSEEKLNHIMHNQYLTFCYNQLTEIQGSLITFGFNFGQYDSHIIDAINIAAKQGKKVRDRLWSIYIGVYSDKDIEHIKKIEKKFKCKVNLYDAKTASIWE